MESCKLVDFEGEFEFDNIKMITCSGTQDGYIDIFKTTVLTKPHILRRGGREQHSEDCGIFLTLDRFKTEEEDATNNITASTYL